MADVIWGDVTNVVDGDTFDVKVTHYQKSNRIEYNDAERIRIAGIDAPELSTAYGMTAKQRLARRIGGKHVRLTVKSRDTYRRLVCDVSLSTKG
jgi:endonuclease YncB( thermonuclease family)